MGWLSIYELAILSAIGLMIIVPFWAIFSKAGYLGAFSILMVIPGVNVIVLYIFAFGRWPSLANGKSIPPGAHEHLS